MSFPIPKDAMDDRLAILGTSGAGKTYLLLGCMERLMHSGARVVGVDPLGVMWGLRLEEDGKRASQFGVVIFGGTHGDLPLTEHSGALIGETVATMGESCIVDLSELPTKAAERRFMVAFLTALYANTDGRKRDPYHLMVDEADRYAPQKPQAGDETLLNRMEEIVRRGRVRGFIPWLVTQRPAVLNKNVLSMADGLVLLKLTSPQDRTQVMAWIEGQADKAEGKRILALLPTMQRGEGVVWIPGRGILEQVKFPPKATFDSSRSPKRGERRHDVATKPIDLGALRDRLATVEAETKANDPAVLRAHIAALQREVKELRVAPPPDLGAIKTARENGAKETAELAMNVGEKLMVELKDSFDDQLEKMISKFKEQIVQLYGVPVRVLYGAKGPLHIQVTDPKPAVVLSKLGIPINIEYGKTRVVKSAQFVDLGTPKPMGAERNPLGVLASVYPAGMTEAQWAVASGLKRGGGTWNAYVSRLRTAGRIERRGDSYFATLQGVTDLGDAVPTMPPPGPRLVDFWASRISGAGPMLRWLADRYPAWTSREAVGAALALTPGGGTFNAYLSRLRSPGLIEVDGQLVRAAKQVMEG